MTNLRTAAQQALEAMRCAVPTGKITLTDWYKSITALRAALAESGRKPLTEEEILSLFRTAGSPVLFARAIEDKHGIV